jgi:hypothetical protein
MTNDAAAALASPAQIRFPGADDPIGCDALQGPARIRHIAVRILAPQPVTVVSTREFRVLAEVPTFPRVRGKGPGLSPRILEESNGKPRISRRVSARWFFNIRKLDQGPSRDGLRFRRDRFEPARDRGPRRGIARQGPWPADIRCGRRGGQSSRHVAQAAALGALLAVGRDACRDCFGRLPSFASGKAKSGDGDFSGRPP